MDARFGPWQRLRTFQERMLGGDAAALPVPRTTGGERRAPGSTRKSLNETPFAGFYLDEVAVPANRFRIPPREMEEMLPQQLLMLDTAAGAMADAGLGREGNERTGVFIGIALDLNSTNFSFRWSMAERAAGWSKELGLDLNPEELEAWTASLRDAAGPPLTANRTMGALGSIVASRIAREFRIGGPSFTLSSEESSGMRALETAVRLLQTGEIDRAVVGAVDLAGDLRAVLGHHAARPLSRSGHARPFDEAADGSIVGEGAAAVVLKRLEDAERDGDRIYAVIKGIGNAGGATVVSRPCRIPSALDRAYGEAGVDPATIGYVEAHGSGHPPEDRMEAAALAGFFAPRADDSAAPARSCAVSSVAADIGHCGAASGLASLVRGCLALYQEIIPSCRSGDNPLPELSERSSLSAAHAPLLAPQPQRRASPGRRQRLRRRRHLQPCGAGRVGTVPPRAELERIAPLGLGAEFLFTVTGDTARGTDAGARPAAWPAAPDQTPTWAPFAGTGTAGTTRPDTKPLALVLLAQERGGTARPAGTGGHVVAAADAGTDYLLPPSLRDRIFFTPRPLGTQAKDRLCLSRFGQPLRRDGDRAVGRWPEVFRRQDAENLFLRQPVPAGAVLERRPPGHHR